MKQKNKKVDFSLCYSMHYLGSLLGSELTGKESNKSRWSNNYSRSEFLIPTHLLTNFKIQKYYLNNSKYMMFGQEIIYLK